MEFIYKGEPKNLRVGKLGGDIYWVTLKEGIVELPEEIGSNLNLKRVNNSMKKITEGQIGQVKVETKQFEEEDSDKKFYKELIKIKGIGPKTAKDITLWGNEDKIKKSVSLGEHLPFRDDISRLLKEKYG
jgi:hypothetical protein